MERIYQFDFYNLATTLRAVYLRGEHKSQDIVFPILDAKDAVEKLLGGNPIELGLSRARADALLTLLTQFVQRHFMRENDKGETALTYPHDNIAIEEWEFSWIRDAIDNFEMVFSDELREAATYRVPNRGIYNTRKLVDAAECTFPEEVAGFIPAGAKLEWRAAGRCLAFGMFTACGFHVARSVEVVLEAYFHAFNGGPDKKLKNWGQFIDALEKIGAAGTTPVPTEKTLGELRQLKDDWRNPLMHPRVVLEEPDARAVFNNGETLVMMMAQELAAISASGIQAPLALVAPATGA